MFVWFICGILELKEFTFFFCSLQFFENSFNNFHTLWAADYTKEGNYKMAVA
jgi:hypothetical protein